MTNYIPRNGLRWLILGNGCVRHIGLLFGVHEKLCRNGDGWKNVCAMLIIRMLPMTRPAIVNYVFLISSQLYWTLITHYFAFSLVFYLCLFTIYSSVFLPANFSMCIPLITHISHHIEPMIHAAFNLHICSDSCYLRNSHSLPHF